jgi:predicted DsbA family dithiol-disulfide isomerase
MHDRLFADQARLDPASIRERAATVGLNLTRFDTCVTNHEARDQVDADREIAKTLGVVGTPTFLVGQFLPDGSIKAAEWIGGAVTLAEFNKVMRKYVTE